MTKVSYTLTNGTVVNTYAEALRSGLRYRATYYKVETPRGEQMPKHEAMRVKVI